MLVKFTALYYCSYMYVSTRSSIQYRISKYFVSCKGEHCDDTKLKHLVSAIFQRKLLVHPRVVHADATESQVRPEYLKYSYRPIIYFSSTNNSANSVATKDEK